MPQAIFNAANVAGIDGVTAYSIALCESHMRQYDEDGTVLRGKVNPLDTGLFQINLRYHAKDAKALGFDIFTTGGNIGYAVYLMHRDGFSHWKASEECWSKEDPGW